MTSTLNLTKMKEIKPSGLFYVPVPMDAFNIIIAPTIPDYVLSYNTKSKIEWTCEILPKGKWELIGSVTADHIDFDPEPYVEAVGDDDYKDYTHHLNVFADENDSFRSLLTANDVHFVNPYGETEPKMEYYLGSQEILAEENRNKRQKWQQAESKLVEKTLILKPIN